jgi:hypothetical protein
MLSWTEWRGKRGTVMASVELETARVRKLVADLVKRTCNNYILGPDKAFNVGAIQSAVNSTLHNLVTGGTINKFKIESVRAGRVPALREVNDLELGAAPGDPVLDKLGNIKALIVSNDGRGNGVIFESHPAESGEIHVKFSVQPPMPPWWINIDVRVPG